MSAAYSKPMSMEAAEGGSTPCKAASTAAASPTDRHKGPMRSRLGVNGMLPRTGTRPKVGRRATMPQRAAGFRMDPKLSVPMENAHSPAAVVEPEPALEPPEGSSMFQ